MSILIVIADASRARFLTADTRDAALVEGADFVHPSSRQREQDLISDGHSSGKDVSGFGHHSMREEKKAHVHEEEVFARELCSEIDKLLQRAKPGRLYLIAAPPFLGKMRAALSKQALSLVAGEIDKSLVQSSVKDIRSYLPKLL